MNDTTIINDTIDTTITNINDTIDTTISNINDTIDTDTTITNITDTIDTKNMIPPYENSNTKKINWGIGIEHEWVPAIKITSPQQAIDILKKISIAESYDVKYENLIKDSITKLLKQNKPLYLYIKFDTPETYKIEKKFKFSNPEWTGLYHLAMLETKNMIFANVLLLDVINELKNNTKTIMKSLNTQSMHDIGMKLEIVNEGAVMYLCNYNYNYSNDYEYYYDNITNNTNNTNNKLFSINKNLNLKNLKIITDSAGSYHFWITLPHYNTDIKKYITLLHQKAAYLLQSIEPLLIAIYGSPDPRYSKKKNIYFGGSFRGGINDFANYGTSNISQYNNKRSLYSRKINSIHIPQPHTINGNHYIRKISNYYKQISKSKKKSIVADNNRTNKYNSISKKSKYIYLKKSMKPFINRTQNHDSIYGLLSGIKKKIYPRIGANIRRKEKIDGFEFRIMDHLPEKDLYNIAQNILIIACMSYELKTYNHLISAATNNAWNDAIVSSLLFGNQCKITHEYIDFLKSQFLLSKLDYNTNSIDVFTQLLDTCLNQFSNKNGYWLMVDKNSKIIVKSQNKIILDKLTNN